MPKRATHTFESEKDGLQDAALSVNYCMCCGEQVLILGPETNLADVPRRRTDGALVLEKEKVTFKLNAKDKGNIVLKRPGGYERQHRLGCWNCGVLLAYRAEPSEDAPLLYLLPDATGQQADLYLAKYKVPQCIQPTGQRSVRVALDVLAGQPKRVITGVNDSEVVVCVCAPAKEGLANAELVEYMATVLGVTKPQLSLSRGWSANSKFLLVSGLRPVDVYKKLKAAVDTEGGNSGGIVTGDGVVVAETGNFVTAGVASGVARRNWEENEDVNGLAPAPMPHQQKFIK